MLHLMITSSNKAAKNYLGILVSLVKVNNLKFKKPNPKQTKHKKPHKGKILLFMCNSYAKF